MTGYILLGVVVVLLLGAATIYNRLVTNKNLVAEGWSGINVQLKRRNDLIPNLIEAVKGYMRLTMKFKTILVTAAFCTLAFVNCVFSQVGENFSSGVPKGGYILLELNQGISEQATLSIINQTSSSALYGTVDIGLNSLGISRDTAYILDSYVFAKSVEEANQGNFIISLRVNITRKIPEPPKCHGMAFFFKKGVLVSGAFSSNIVPTPVAHDGWYGELPEEREEKKANQEGYHKIKGYGPRINRGALPDPYVTTGSEALRKKCIEIFEEKHLTGVHIRSCEVFAESIFKLKTNTCDIKCIADSDQGSAYLLIRFDEGTFMPNGVKFGEFKPGWESYVQ